MTHPDTIADHILAVVIQSAADGVPVGPSFARHLFRQATGATRDQATRAIKRALVRRGLKSSDASTRALAMSVHVR